MERQPLEGARTQGRNQQCQPKDEVRAASQRFYAALNSMANGDAGPMSEIWSHADTVTTMHPIGGRKVGWDAIRGSFEQVAGLASGGKIGLRDQVVQVGGDLAYEIGVEYGQFTMAGHQADIEQRVTNVYQRQGGAWKIVHHHTDVSQTMLDILAKL